MPFVDIYHSTNQVGSTVWDIYISQSFSNVALAPPMTEIYTSSDLVLNIAGEAQEYPAAGAMPSEIKFTIYDELGTIWSQLTSSLDPMSYKIRVVSTIGVWRGFLRVSTQERPRFRNLMPSVIEVYGVCGLAMLQDLGALPIPYAIHGFFKTTLIDDLHPENALQYVCDLEQTNRDNLEGVFAEIYMSGFDPFLQKNGGKISRAEQFDTICKRFNLRAWQSLSGWWVYELGREGKAQMLGIGMQNTVTGFLNEVALPANSVSGVLSADTIESLLQPIRSLRIAHEVPENYSALRDPSFEFADNIAGTNLAYWTNIGTGTPIRDANPLNAPSYVVGQTAIAGISAALLGNGQEIEAPLCVVGGGNALYPRLRFQAAFDDNTTSPNPKWAWVLFRLRLKLFGGGNLYMQENGSWTAFPQLLYMRVYRDRAPETLSWNDVVCIARGQRAGVDADVDALVIYVDQMASRVVSVPVGTQAAVNAILASIRAAIEDWKRLIRPNFLQRDNFANSLQALAANLDGTAVGGVPVNYYPAKEALITELKSVSEIVRSLPYEPDPIPQDGTLMLQLTGGGSLNTWFDDCEMTLTDGDGANLQQWGSHFLGQTFGTDIEISTLLDEGSTLENGIQRPLMNSVFGGNSVPIKAWMDSTTAQYTFLDEWQWTRIFALFGVRRTRLTGEINNIWMPEQSLTDSGQTFSILDTCEIDLVKKITKFTAFERA